MSDRGRGMEIRKFVVDYDPPADGSPQVIRHGLGTTEVIIRAYYDDGTMELRNRVDVLSEDEVAFRVGMFDVDMNWHHIDTDNKTLHVVIEG